MPVFAAENLTQIQHFGHRKTVACVERIISIPNPCLESLFHLPPNFSVFRIADQVLHKLQDLRGFGV